MSNSAGLVKLESMGNYPASGGLCPDCNEHMQEAKRIQSSLLPTQGFRHESVDIAFRFKPFSEVGGDFADFFHLPDGIIGIYLGDVVGKGLPAAMYGALVMGTLTGLHKTGADTAQVLSLLNQRLIQRSVGGRFCMTLYALFNPATRELTFSNAGMPMPLLAAGSVCRQVGEGGLPLGIFPWATHERQVVQLAPGDCVLFATDGLHELRNGQEIEFCTSEIEEVWAQCQPRSASESLDFVFDRQLTFADGYPAHDDITAVVLKVLA